jgi:hypothetical protein
LSTATDTTRQKSAIFRQARASSRSATMALLFGAELNAELDRQADIRAGGENAGLVKPARRSN